MAVADKSPADPSPPRCRRFQFSLRGVFRFTIVAALASGWLALAIRESEFQSQKLMDDGFIRIAREEQEQGAAQVLVGRYAITVPRYRYILVRTKAGMGAFMLTNEISTGDGGVTYRWYFRPDMVGSFTQPDAITGESSVYERYIRVPGKQGNNVTDAGGQTQIKCGPIVLEWSLGNHFYLPMDEPVEIAYTHESDIADVRADDPSLIWCRHRPPNAGSE